MRCVLLCVGLLAATSSLQGQVISGTLMESESRAPLRGGLVTLLDRDSTVEQFRTDTAGAFHFTVPRGGSYQIHAEQTGYRAATSTRLTVGPRDTLQVEFSLARDVLVLEPLVVTGHSRRLTPAAQRFYDRATNNITGDFITRAQIEKAHPLRTTELLHRIPGVQTSMVMGGNTVTIRGTCRPTVYVDGVRVEGYRTIDDLVQPLELEGVEVYRSADQAPAEYTGLRAGCAAVLLWTRIE